MILAVAGLSRREAMKRVIRIALGTGSIISGAPAISIGAAMHAAPQARPASRAEYSSALAQLERTRLQQQARCEGAGIGKELCRAQAEADEMLRVAGIEANFRRDRESTRAAQRARIEARYVVERAKCAAVGGLQRARSPIAAHAARVRALLEMAAPYEVRG